MKALILMASAAAAVATPAFAARQIITPSGRPDAIFTGSDLAAAESKVANQCMNKGWQVAEQTPNQITCEVPVGMLASVLQQMALGNSYSTTPRTFVRFSLAQVGPHTRAQAMAWTETQMAFGQVRQMQYTDDKTFDGLQSFLMAAGGELPPGTTFPGTFLGVEGEAELNGKVTTIPVTKIYPGTAAEAAGLHSGDRILKVNGKTFKDKQGFVAAQGKIAVGVRYPLTVVRDGKEEVLMVEARQRPAVGTPEWDALQKARLINSPVAPPAEPAPATTSTSVPIEPASGKQ